MDMEKYVPSLELCKRLKELGVPQRGEFWWVCHHGVNDEYHLTQLENSKKSEGLWNVYVAPLSDELLAWLPDVINLGSGDCFLSVEKITNQKQIDLWEVKYRYIKDHMTAIPHSSRIGLSNNSADMLIYLLENKLIKAEDLK